MVLYCYDCGQENHPDRKYCKNCGISLSRKCRACDFINQADAKFCGGCGLEISAVPTLDAERRQLTVMFCDLVGSSELAEQHDPEEMRDLLSEFQKTVAEVMLKYGGNIAKYIGDGLLIYFGHPYAHEDDARRSVLAGLGIIEKIKKLNIKLSKDQKVELGVRIGIHTGLVVIGQMGSGEARESNAIVGETPNIAARIESLAKPNTVTISHSTYELTKGLFVTTEKEPQNLKGVSQPIKLYEVASESSLLSDFDVRIQLGLTPLVGRSKELNFLEHSWEQTKKGIGQLVWLSGEAGVGKSRVINEFMSKVFNSPQNLRLYYCSAVHSSTAFYPIISHLKRLLKFDSSDSNEEKFQKLEKFLDARALPLGDVAPLLSPLLDIERPTESKTTPETIKRAIIDSWFSLMVKMAEQKPLLLIFEDAHWIDPSTQELIDILSSQIASHRILLLITSRPSYHFSVKDGVSLQSLTINRLDQASSMMLVNEVGGSRKLPEELVDELVAKADGVPLFIEELTKAVMNSDLLTRSEASYELSAPLSSLSIPNSLKDSLMARLDQLSAVKNVAQVAATIGRQFSIELLESVSVHSPKEIRVSVDKLLKAQIIFISNESGTTYYQFSHALLQETAYHSLLKSIRKQYHGLIAESIIRSFPELEKSEPEILALHCSMAGKTEKAVSYWLAAGKKANEISSHNEAITHFTKGIELLNTLPDSQERFVLEFQIQVRLIGPLIAAKSYTSPEVEKAFTRALELSKYIGNSPEIFPVLHSRYAFYQVCGLINKAELLVDEFYEVAALQKDMFTDLECIGNRMRGSSAFLMGNSKEGEKYFKSSIQAYQYEKHKSLITLYGQDSKVAALSYLSLNQWHYGKLSEIAECSNTAITLAKKLSSANTTGISYFVGSAMPYALLNEPEKVLEFCNTLITIAKSQETPLWQAVGKLFKGWALVCLDQQEEGMGLLDEGMGAYDVMKVALFRPLITLLYAEACLKMNLVVKGISALEESLALSSQGGECWLDAETHRFMGELHLVKPSPERKKALEEFKLSLKIAQEQASPTQELRICMSLLNFADKKDDILSAKERLQAVYDTFDKKQQSKDLEKAHLLLNS